uniref:Uncharacterized protein n=1 Tax=viral metagenome TaxID=1070528 RepID=A0A6C0F347_9ZZZZ
MPNSGKDFEADRDLKSIKVTEPGNNKGSIWLMEVFPRNLYFGSHFAICCSTNNKNCRCQRSAHWSQFDLIVDVSMGSNPPLIPDEEDYPCETVDFKNRAKITTILGYEGVDPTDNEDLEKEGDDDLDVENHRFLTMVSASDECNILDRIQTCIEGGGNVLIHDNWGYQRAPSLVVCYLIKYYHQNISKEADEASYEGQKVEYVKEFVAKQRPSVLGYGASGVGYAAFQPTFDAYWAYVTDNSI